MSTNKSFITFLGILIFISILSSCKKEQENTPDDNPTGGNTDTTGTTGNPSDSIYMSLTAMADGAPFSADTTMLTHEFDSDLNLHVFTAPDSEGHIVTLMMASLELGTYEVDFDNNIVIYQSGLTIFNGGFNPDGQIIITHNDGNTISGTFHASLFNFDNAQDLELTSGHFIKIPIQ